MNLHEGDANRRLCQVKLLSWHSRIHLLPLIHLFIFVIVFIPFEFPDSGVATLPSPLVVHSEPGSSLDRPTPLIFIPTRILTYIYHLPRVLLLLLFPLSLPPYPFYLTLSLTLPPAFSPSRSSTCHSVTPRSLHAQRSLILLFFLLCVCPSLSTLHLYHAAANKSHFFM